MLDSLIELERSAFLLLNSPHGNYLDGVMYLISDKYPWTIFAFIYMAILFYRQKRNEALLLFFMMMFLIFMGDQLSSQIIKPLFQRFRPTHYPTTEDVVKTVMGYRGGNYGFVSGHATNFTAFATFTALLFRHHLYTLSVFVVAFTVSYSRIYLGVHFISDVIPGICLGLLVGYFVYRLYTSMRVAFIGILPSQKRVTFISLNRITLMTGALIIFYIIIWSLAPLIIKWYY